MPFQIFVSYARKDNEPPPDGSQRHGFVTFLHEKLEAYLRALGPPEPVIWRDTSNIEDSDQFDPTIAAAIRASDALLVILSNNWMHRKFCQRELEMFRSRWSQLSDSEVRQRIIVVAKNHVDLSRWPALLQGQTGSKFYSLNVREGEDGTGREQEFFGRGELPREFFELVERLSKNIWRRANNHEEPEQRTDPNARRKSRGPARVVYVAKTSKDMEDAYARVVNELEGSGFTVVPDSAVDIPQGEEALAFVDEALRRAEASIHLLGELPGYKPTPESAPIVKLQLARAALRASADESSFRRLIWAPKFVIDERGRAITEEERDPLQVLARFHHQLDDDSIVSDEMVKFVQFVMQFLRRTAPATARPEPIGADTSVYIYHAEEDTEYAVELIQALQALDIEPSYPIFEGDPVTKQAWHEDHLRDSDAVLLCWANAPETWPRTRLPELGVWNNLRDKKFECRALVAGPPPGVRKGVLLKVPPHKDVDVVLDLTQEDHIDPGALGPLVQESSP